jgi:hypothetical protein
MMYGTPGGSLKGSPWSMAILQPATLFERSKRLSEALDEIFLGPFRVSLGSLQGSKDMILNDMIGLGALL